MLGESEVSFALPRDVSELENIRAGRALSHPWFSPSHFPGKGNGDSEQQRHLAKASC